VILWVVRACVFWTVMGAQAPEAPDPKPLRLYASATLHIGLRPAFDYGNGVGATLQVSW
jgi:hypothetical protein